MAFKDIVGHDGAKSLLKNSVLRGKLAHAMVFIGPGGVGRGTCAAALAQLLNCEAPENGDGCGKCSGCVKTARTAHPDLKIITPGGSGDEIGIESIRRLRKEIRMKPLEGGYNVAIIEQADKLNEESSNALLKILEEPPGDSVIILLASDLYSLLPTIRSRCMVVRFGRLGEEEVIEVLSRGIVSDRSEAALLARLCEGSPGKAARMHGAGLENRKKFLEWFSGGDVGEENIFSAAEKDLLPGKNAQEKRERLKEIFDILLSWYSDVLLAAAGGGPLINRDYAGGIKPAAEKLKIGGAAEAMGVILNAEETLRLFANPRLVFENTMLKLKTLF